MRYDFSLSLFRTIQAWCIRELYGSKQSKPGRSLSKSSSDCPPVRTFVAKLGGKTSAPHPLICYGHQAEAFARHVSEHSSLNTLVPEDLEGLAHVCECEGFASVGLDFAGLIAQSRPEFNGEAGKAIRVFREKQRRRAASFYGAWDYNVSRAAGRALEYEADGIVMPGTDANELFTYLLGVLDLVESGSAAPTTLQEHIDRLREFAPASPFWEHQDAVDSEHF